MASVLLYWLVTGFVLGHLGFAYDYAQRVNFVREGVTNRIESELEDGVEAYTKLIYDGVQHAHFFAEIPLMKRTLSDLGGENREILAPILERFANAFGRYSQVRVLDSEGKEQLRFDHSAVGDGVVRITALQDKFDTDSFELATSLPPGGAYVSAISPNSENGELQRPPVPTYTTVVPVDIGEDNSTRVGFFVLNTRVGDFLQSVASELVPQLDSYTVFFTVIPSDSQRVQCWILREGEWSYQQEAKIPIPAADYEVFVADGDPRATFNRFKQESTAYLAQNYDVEELFRIQTSMSSNLSVSVVIDNADWDALVARMLPSGWLTRYFVILSRSILGSLVLAFVTLAYLEAAVRIKRSRDALQKKLDTDHLTGVLSRSGFEARRSELREMASFTEAKSAICFLDIDNFKLINDTHGHATGDRVLAQLARVLDRELRDTDLLARWGGEEFLVMLPNVSTHVAHAVVERYRKAVEDFIFIGSNSQMVRVTISIGVSMCLKQDFEAALEAADNALYEAKRLGRNKVVFSAESYATRPVIEIGSIVPNVFCRSDCGSFKLHDYIGEKWLVLFSHPKDFTPVCSTELVTIAQMGAQWDRRNTKILALSVDPVAEHERWKADLATISSCEVFFPIVADDDLVLSKMFDMLPEDAYLTNGWMAEDTETVRGVFIVSPDKRLQASLMYPMSIGRNFADIIRILDSLQGDVKARTIA
ncbi:MAG: diguanylate cyclase [Halieaceae bacterium]|nr:diguanylate cyclase [Halieaceae bacterium]